MTEFKLSYIDVQFLFDKNSLYSTDKTSADTPVGASKETMIF